VTELIAHLREASAPARARRLLVWLAPASVEPLIDLLDDGRAREDAALALGATHDSRALEPLCSIMLGDDPAPVRRAAAWALGELKDQGAVEPLLLATGDRDYDVRSEASASFDRLGNAAIAVAMSALVRPALENGSSPPPAALPPRDEEDPADTLPPPAERPGPEALFSTRAAPVLRRLLGRQEAPDRRPGQRQPPSSP
jgi:hypothetical protein